MRFRVFPPTPSPQTVSDPRSSSRGVGSSSKFVRRSTARFARPRLRPSRAGRRRFTRKRPYAPRLALLRFLLPSALRLPSAPFNGRVTSPTRSVFRFSRPLDGFSYSGLCGLVSCRSRSWDSPFRAFPFQKAVLLSKPAAPLRFGTSVSSRSCLPTIPFPAFHPDRPPVAAHEAGPPREGPLRLAIPRRVFHW